LAHAADVALRHVRQRTKVFCFFFSKKKTFLPFCAGANVSYVAAMTDSDVYAFLKQTFKTVFGREDIPLGPALTARDVVGWDSLKQVEIALALEEHYGIRLRTRDLNNCANVGELVALVERMRAARP
jgi:acyl carrier protein